MANDAHQRPNKTLNRSLHAAKASKKDEFYTQLSDIEKELRHYTHHFEDKTVLCNCDDPRVSHFFHYFTHHFERLGLKRLITTCYQNRDAALFSDHDDAHGLHLEYTGDLDGNKVPDLWETGIHELKGDGDFRSEECVELLKQADIVVTNPPFSLFREYVEHLIEHEKKFLIIGNQNAISYKEIFNLIKGDEIWLGYEHPVAFRVPDHYEMREVRSWRDEDGHNWRSLGNACWFTNLDIAKRHETLPLYTKYDPKLFPEYDNYRAIDVSKYKEIPGDYDGVMGVPVTFLEHYNPDQFEIVGLDRYVEGNTMPKKRMHIRGKEIYARILIRRQGRQ